ncbi:SGNH/GDSL hydrolase family protein [Halocynthiibacter sp.]|uniref:SGNH/GDSL hydrolase family protein n=1 Tax=Halocynthiibacter sp. TaxID=1979210 RepID=UPI003C329131
MGDSMLAWNRSTGRSVADYLARETNGFVADQSRNGASYFTQVRPLAGIRGNIPSQFLDGDWDWIVLNGGGNDLLFGCGCNACDAHIRRLIDRNHDWGAIPDLIHFLLQTTDAKVIYTGYLRSPGRSSMIEHCASSGSELEQRISHMARTTNRLFFLSLQDLVPHGDLTYHSAARIHPSPKGSAAIAARISALIHQ